MSQTKISLKDGNVFQLSGDTLSVFGDNTFENILRVSNKSTFFLGGVPFTSYEERLIDQQVNTVAAPEFSMLQLSGGTWVVISPNELVTSVSYLDNQKLTLGTDTDTQIYFNGTQTNIDLFTGDLVVRDNTSNRFSIERLTGDVVVGGGISIGGNSIINGYIDLINGVNSWRQETNGSGDLIFTGFYGLKGTWSDIELTIVDNLIVNGTGTFGNTLRVNAPTGNTNRATLELYANNGGTFGGSNVVRSKVESLTDGTSFGSILAFYVNNTSNVYEEKGRFNSTGFDVTGNVTTTGGDNVFKSDGGENRFFFYSGTDSEDSQFWMYNNAASNTIRFRGGGDSFLNTGGGLAIGSTSTSGFMLNVSGAANFSGTVTGANATASNHFITKGQYESGALGISNVAYTNVANVFSEQQTIQGVTGSTAPRLRLLSTGFWTWEIEGDGHDFKIQSDSTDRIVINANTNTIALNGNTSIDGQLTVYSNAISTTVSVDSPTRGGGYTIKRNGNSVGGFFNTGAIQGNTSEGLALFAETGKDISFMVNGSPTIQSTLLANGNWLMNTTTDNGAKLQVNGTGTFSGNVGIGTNNPDIFTNGFERNVGVYTTSSTSSLNISGGVASRIQLGAGTTRYGIIYQDATNFMQIGTTTALPISFTTNAAEGMRLASSNNLLIGTTTDNGARLQVNGTGTFSGTVSGANATASNHFITKGQYDSGVLSIANVAYINIGQTFVGNQAITGTLTTTGTGTFGGAIYANGGLKIGTGQGINNNTDSSRDKIRVWNSGEFAIGMGGGYTFGALNDYAMTFQMDNTAGRGWWWGTNTHSNAQGAMSLTTGGKLNVASSLRLGYGESDTSAATGGYALQVFGTGTFSGEVEASNFTDSSDIRLKSEIVDYSGGLSAAKLLNFKYYKKADRYELGLIANDYQYHDQLGFMVHSGEKYLGIDYKNIHAIAINSILELDKRTEKVETKVQKLEKDTEIMKRIIEEQSDLIEKLKQEVFN